MIKDNVKNEKEGIYGGIKVDKMKDIVEGKDDWVVVGSDLYKGKDTLMVEK